MTAYDGAVRIQGKDGRDLLPWPVVNVVLNDMASASAPPLDLSRKAGEPIARDQSLTLVPAPSATARS